MNICGCLVHVAPEKSESARRQIAATEGVEIHAESEDSRFVVIVEDTAKRLASETIMDLHQIPGVISLTLNYHHFENTSKTRPRRPNSNEPTARGQAHDHL